MAIKFETGPMPAMQPRKTDTRTELQQAMLDMPPGSWFIVPGTKGMTSKQARGLVTGITRFCRRMKIVGVAAGLAADGSGLVVRKTGELDTPARPQTTTGPGPVVSTRPKASRI